MAAVSANSTAVDSTHDGSQQNATLVSDPAMPKRTFERVTIDSHVSTPSRSSSTTSSPDVASARRRKPVQPRRVNAAQQIRVTNGDGNDEEDTVITIDGNDPVRERRGSEPLSGEAETAQGPSRKRPNGDSASDDGEDVPARKQARLSANEVESVASTNSDVGKPSPAESLTARNGEPGANNDVSTNANRTDEPSSGKSRQASGPEKTVALRAAANSVQKTVDTYDEALRNDSFFWLDSYEWLSRPPRSQPYKPSPLPHFVFEYLRKVQRAPSVDEPNSRRKADKVYLYRCAECSDTFLTESSFRMHRARRTNLIFYDCPALECTSDPAHQETSAEGQPAVNGGAESETTKPKRPGESERPKAPEKKGRLRFYNRCTLLAHVRRHGAQRIDARRVAVAAIPFEFWRADYVLGLIGTSATDPVRMSELENLFAPSASCSTQPSVASAFVPSLLPLDEPAPFCAQSLNPLRVASLAGNDDTLFDQAESAMGSIRPDLRARISARNDELHRRNSQRFMPARREAPQDEPDESNRLRKRSLRNRAQAGGEMQRTPSEPQRTQVTESNQQQRVAQQEPIDLDEEYPFSCQACGAGFQSREKLGAHLNTMRTAPALCCTLCQLPCATECQHEAHMRLHRIVWGGAGASNAHADDRMLMCPECGQMLPTSDLHELRTHVRVNCCHFQRTLMFVCSKCQRAFYNLTQLREHLLRLHATNGLACPVQSCPLVFSTFEQLATHATRKHTGVPLDLEACAARAAQSGGANSRTKCPICADLFPVTPSGRAAFERHVDEVHLKPSSIDIQTFVYRCIHCLQLFSGARVLGPHLGRQHRDAAVIRNPGDPLPNRVACLFCAESFSSSREALLHEQCDHIQAVAAKPASNVQSGNQRA